MQAWTRMWPATLSVLAGGGAAALSPWTGPAPFAVLASLALAWLVASRAGRRTSGVVMALLAVIAVSGALVAAVRGSGGLLGWVGAELSLAGGWWLGHHLGDRAQEAEAELVRERRRGETLAIRDEMTGHLNERGLRLVARPMLETARRSGAALHCAVVDVDAVARVNARFGQDAGDEVILAVAESLAGSVRSGDVVSRWDADVFVVIGAGTGMGPGELQRRVRARLVLAPPLPRAVWPTRVSAGVAVLEPWDSGDLDWLLHRAFEDLSVRRALTRPAASDPLRRPVGPGT